MSMTLQLLGLVPSIQEKILSVSGQPLGYHLGLRPLAKIAALSAEKQLMEFTVLLKRWQTAAEKVEAVVQL